MLLFGNAFYINKLYKQIMEEKLKNILKKKQQKEEKKDKRGPKTPHQLLALDIAQSFGKTKSRKDVAILMNLCKKYPDSYIRNIWGIVKEKNINNPMAYFLGIIKHKNIEEKNKYIKNKKIIFIGTSEFGVPTLEKLKENNFNIIKVITAPDKASGRKNLLTPSPIKKTAEKLKLSLLQPEKINSLSEKLKKLKPDLIILASYGQIIPPQIIKIPPLGILNIHPSLLPKYRGPSPIQTAILNKEKTTGVTIMLIDEKIDHGKIIKQQKLPIKNKNYTELHDELAKLGAKLLIKTLPNYIFGKLKPKEQNHKKATYTKILTKKDGKINWNRKAQDIDALIRAFYPWPGTWSYIKTKQGLKKIKIIKATLLNSRKKNKTPGKIFKTKNKKMAVKCGQGNLILEIVQLEGKKPISGEDFLKGYPEITNFQ